jgi:flavoprotein
MPGIRDFVLAQAAPLADGVFKAGITRAMGAYDTLAIEHAKVRSNLNLSDTGKRTETMKFLKANAHEIVRVQKLVENVPKSVCFSAHETHLTYGASSPQSPRWGRILVGGTVYSDPSTCRTIASAKMTSMA